MKGEQIASCRKGQEDVDRHNDLMSCQEAGAVGRGVGLSTVIITSSLYISSSHSCPCLLLVRIDGGDFQLPVPWDWTFIPGQVPELGCW